MRFDSLAEWLSWQESLHPRSIDLGLERLGKVLRRLGLARPDHTIITVAGTNGKGSSVAMLESILRAAGYRVGAYTSPHLLRYNERIRIDGKEIDDARLCQAFQRIDEARGEISLTYFEFGTLAAFDLFAAGGLDAAILEVGMGGRLDAVNLFDPDVALITAIDVDHAAWLGGDRETIAREKAGIMRANRPAVCSDAAPPARLIEEAAAKGARLLRLGQEFGYSSAGDSWSWYGPGGERRGLPRPALTGEFQLANAAGVLMALDQLAERLPLGDTAVQAGLTSACLPGRYQCLAGEPVVILDVAHNPQAARELATNLRSQPFAGRTLAVFGLLQDKDAEGIIAPLKSSFDRWHVGGLFTARGASAAEVGERLRSSGCSGVFLHPDVSVALAAARAEAGPADRIVVFGSFYTVAEALRRTV